MNVPPSLDERAGIIAEVCQRLAGDNVESARDYLRESYSFVPIAPVKRRYGPVQMTAVFARDGFIDRYSGDRLIFPPVFPILTHFLGPDFPVTPGWRTEATHPAYWELGATVDHMVPVTLGGPDEERNWVTTSMARNLAKLNSRLEDLGWSLHAPGDMARWDGMLGWFVEVGGDEPALIAKGSLLAWDPGRNRPACRSRQLHPARGRRVPHMRCRRYRHAVLLGRALGRRSAATLRPARRSERPGAHHVGPRPLVWPHQHRRRVLLGLRLQRPAR
jgi:hypothetical protein